MTHLPETTPDGRIGFPTVRQYKITEGSKKGELRPVPPLFTTDPYEGSEDYVKASVAYEVVVHDPEADAEMRERGFWVSFEHAGFSFMVDNRRTS